MHPGELPSGPASSHATWSANSLIDQNAALWASLRPAARPSWPVLVRQRVSELSLTTVGERLHLGLPRWFGSRQTAQRWLLSAAGGIVIGLGLGLAARFSEAPLPPLEQAPSAAPRVVVAPVPEPSVGTRSVQNSAVEAAPALAVPEVAPPLEPDAPKLSDPTPPKRAAVAKKKKLKASSKRRAKTAGKRKRPLTTSR